jgi:hypothetical protein
MAYRLAGTGQIVADTPLINRHDPGGAGATLVIQRFLKPLESQRSHRLPVPSPAPIGVSAAVELDADNNSMRPSSSFVRLDIAHHLDQLQYHQRDRSNRQQ